MLRGLVCSERQRIESDLILSTVSWQEGFGRLHWVGTSRSSCCFRQRAFSDCVCVGKNHEILCRVGRDIGYMQTPRLTLHETS